MPLPNLKKLGILMIELLWQQPVMKNAEVGAMVIPHSALVDQNIAASHAAVTLYLVISPST